MAKRESKMKNNHCCTHHTTGMYIVKGIISVILGLILMLGYLNLAQVFSILLLLVGIKFIFWCRG